PDGRQYRKLFAQINFMRVSPNGSLTAGVVRPGAYRVQAFLEGADRMIAETEAVHVVIPPPQPGREDEPFDLGSLVLRPTILLKPGDAAPGFDVSTLAGGPLKLADYRGRYVLLDFWATWCGPCVRELPNIANIREAHLKDSRLAIISLSVDSKIAAP